MDSISYFADLISVSLGVDEADVNMVHMDFAQCYQAFLADQVDVAALTSPYCFQTDDSMVRAAGLDDLGVALYEQIIITDKAYNDPEIKELMPIFLKVLYQINDELEADFDKKVVAVSKWYSDCGTSSTEEGVIAECNLKPFITSEQAKELKLGEYEKIYTEFMISQDKLTPDKVEVVLNNMAPEFLQEALK